MAITYPLSQAEFYDMLLIDKVDFNLSFTQEHSSSGGGDMLTADLAPAKWVAKIETIRMSIDDAESVMAQIRAMSGIKTFYLGNPLKLYPKNDPNGSILGANSPIVAGLVNSYTMGMSGLPANYVINRGDYFSISFGSPARKYLGQFAESGTASAGGILSAKNITPALPAGVINGDAISLKKPVAKFKLQPDSAFTSYTDRLFQRIKFEAVQTFEAN